MGVFTSSQLMGKKNDAGVAYGNKPAAPKVVDLGLVFKFKVPVSGKSHISVPIGDSIEKLELVDGVYEIKQNMKKKAELQKWFSESPDFEQVVVVASKKPEAKVDTTEYIYFAGHPENTDDEKITGEISVEVDGKEVTLDCVEGCVTTEYVEVYQALLAKGYYEFKPRAKK